MVNIKLFLIISVVLLLIIPIILQYIYGWSIFFWIDDKTYNISVYGFYLLGYMILQFLFAILNNKLKEVDNSGNVINKVNIMIVGNKEDPLYYRMCLESILNVSNNMSNLNKVYVIIDGNEKEDDYMVDICKDVFNDKRLKYIKLDDERVSEEVLLLHMLDINENEIICISQKNGGKRNAMMTGFKYTLLENVIYKGDIGVVFCTDSDTVVNVDSVMEMCKHFDKENIGAVVGNLGIYNKYDAVISFMSSVRYWYAFNVERAYQSFTGNVLCVSGPIGMYRTSDLEKIIDEWSNQKFLGKLCTYGDDRHLTNKILELKKNVVYVSSAYAETETPNNIYRFFKQQTRWNKSAFREFFWSIKILDKQSMFMTVDLIYVLVYPYIVMGYLLYILWYKSVFELGFYLVIVLGLGVIKSIYGVIVSGKIENMFYFLYVFIYVCVVFPSKLWALININDNSWGTSPRKFSDISVSIDIIVPIIWNILLIGGVIYNIYNSIRSGFILMDFLLLFIVCGILFISFITMNIYVFTKRSNMKRVVKQD
jgi:hyaluronan synthase